MMKSTRISLNSEIRQLSSNPSASPQAINFQKVIAKQQEVISSLQQEILMLKSYITLHKSSNFEPLCTESSTISTSSSNDTLGKQLEESVSNGYKNLEKNIKEIVSLLELKEGTELDDPRLIETIRQLKETAAKKQDPIFVERIKEIKVPITVEKIIEKPIEKIIQKVVEKIVYVERPAYKQRMGDRDRYPSRQYENEQHEVVLNKTYSDRNLNKTMINYREEKYQEKYQEKGRYDQYKRNQTGNNLIKKRSQATKNFNTRKDYY